MVKPEADVDLLEFEMEFAAAPGHRDLIKHIRAQVQERLKFRSGDGFTPVPVRFAITHSDDRDYHCEVGVVAHPGIAARIDRDEIFRFVPRRVERTEKFTGVFVLPTGVGCKIGGHSGDATPAVRLAAAACDRLITHPNAVNGADLNEMPENTLYVEGSVLSRLLMGTVGLQPVRMNRLLNVIDQRDDPIFGHNAQNSFNAAAASGGFHAEHTAVLDPRMVMDTRYTSSGRAAGTVKGLESVCRIIEHYQEMCDAIAITTVIDLDVKKQNAYFDNCAEVVNPYGGVEAMLTHTLSLLYNLPSAHSPMYENREIMNSDPGVMEPRVAAEGVSVSFLHCIYKGLHRSPRIVTETEAMQDPAVITAADVSCLVIPDGCLGLPTMAALEQGIPVIAVSGNGNKMCNVLSGLPWRSGQFQRVESYLEATGMMLAIRDGIAPKTLRRPIDISRLDEWRREYDRQDCQGVKPR